MRASRPFKRKWFLLLATIFTIVVIFQLKTALPSVLVPPSPNIPQEALEELTVYRVEFKPGEILVHVLNTGPVNVRVVAVQVGGVGHSPSLWSFFVEPSDEIPPLGSATVRVFFSWIAGDPYTIKLITSSGTTFTVENVIAALTITSPTQVLTIGTLLGTFVGIIPVFLGLLVLPFFRRISDWWIDFLALFAVGVLIWLLIDTADEGAEVARRLPLHIGPPLIVVGFVIGIMSLVVYGWSTYGKYGKNASVLTDGGRLVTPIAIAYLISLGIGLHNFGEGLAIGAAYSLGNIVLGATLVIGFALHNVTEGFAIAAPVSHERIRLRQPLAWGLLAGAPTILGTWLSLVLYSDAIAVFFFGIAAGAILYVVIEVVIQVASSPRASNNPLNYTGLLLGLFIMYVTAVALEFIIKSA